MEDALKELRREIDGGNTKAGSGSRTVPRAARTGLRSPGRWQITCRAVASTSSASAVMYLRLRHALRPFSSAIGKRPLFPHLPPSGRVVPRLVVRQEAVGLVGAPAAADVAMDWDHVAEYRVDDAPGGFDGVLPGEEPAIAR